MKISEIQITPIKSSDGLVGFASCVIDRQLFLSSLGVHTKLDGSGYRITYPTRRVGSRSINFYHPISKDAGTAIEQAINAKCIELFKRSDDINGRHNKAAAANS